MCYVCYIQGLSSLEFVCLGFVIAVPWIIFVPWTVWESASIGESKFPLNVDKFFQEAGAWNIAYFQNFLYKYLYIIARTGAPTWYIESVSHSQFTHYKPIIGSQTHLNIFYIFPALELKSHVLTLDNTLTTISWIK